MRPRRFSVSVDLSLKFDVGSRPWSPWQAAKRLAILIAVTAVAAFFAVPMIWLVLQSSQPGGLGLVQPWTFGSFNQIVLNWDVIFSQFWAGGDTQRWLLNSVFYSGSGAAIAVACCVPAGYALATHDFRGRKVLLTITMLVMLIPTNALVLPLFLEANSVHLLSSPLAVILPYGLFPFGVYLAYLYFNTARFEALFQTARMDGCDEWHVFRRIAVPLAMPVAALIVFLDFVASWTNFFLPWVMYWSLDMTSRYPVALGIALQLSTGETFGSPVPGALQLQTTSPASQIALLVLVTSAPVLVVFVLAQRWIGSGRVQGIFD